MSHPSSGGLITTSLPSKKLSFAFIVAIVVVVVIVVVIVVVPPRLASYHTAMFHKAKLKAVILILQEKAKEEIQSIRRSSKIKKEEAHLRSKRLCTKRLQVSTS